MTITLLITVLKYLGTTVSGLYGIYATLTDFYRNENGGRRLTRKGYFGIALLGLSLVLSLSMNVLNDIREREEASVRRAKEERLVTQLSEQVEATNKILTESLERVESFEVELFISVSPLAFRDIEDRPLLSERMQKVLAAEKLGVKELEDKDYDTIVNELRGHYDLVRKQLFREWELNVTLDHEKKSNDRFSHDMWIRRQMEDDLASFVISHVSDHVDGFTGVQCWLVYRFSPNRAAGFRTFGDFNGAKIAIEVQGNPKIMDVTTIRFHFGEGGGRKPLFIQRDEFTNASGGEWAAEKNIPKDYF